MHTHYSYKEKKTLFRVIFTAAIEGILIASGDGCVTSAPTSIQSLFFKQYGLKKKKEKKKDIQKY